MFQKKFHIIYLRLFLRILKTLSEYNSTPSLSSISFKICTTFAGVLPTKTFNLSIYFIKVRLEILFTKNLYHIETNQ